MSTISQDYERKDPHEILMILGIVHLQAQNVLSMQEITLDEAQRLTESVVHARNLLTLWGMAESRLRRNMHLIGLINDMKKRYLELEGMVKESRNSLIRRIQPNNLM